jgi:hypothetical protein
MEQKTKKWILTAGIAVPAYYALSLNFTQLPQIALLTQSFNGFNILTIAAAVSAYAIYYIHQT